MGSYSCRFLYTGMFTLPLARTMQKRPTKHEIREQLEREMKQYLQHGGSVKEVPRGATGLVDGRYGQPISFEKPKEERTPLSDVLKTIDQRREDRKKSKPIIKTPSGPKKTIIYDDFGEPLRIVWDNN